MLTYHVVAGKMDAATLMKEIEAGKRQGHADRPSRGGTLHAMSSGGKVMLDRREGRHANVTIADVFQSNGVIHVVDKVLLPK